MTREVIAGLHERIDRLERLIEVVIQKVAKLQQKVKRAPAREAQL